MFVASSRSFSETEREPPDRKWPLRTDLLSEDRHAGFYGEISTFGTLPPVGAPPDPCSTTLATLRTASVPVQGVDFVPGNPDLGKLPSCIPIMSPAPMCS
jgi:hypothetical protein